MAARRADGRAARTGEGSVGRQRGRLDRNGVAARRRSAAVLRRGDWTWRACRCSTAHRTVAFVGPFPAMWLAMILAMAPPLLLREIGRLWRTSLRRLRHLTLAWFLCGYVGIWLLGRRRSGDALRMGDRQFRAYRHGDSRWSRSGTAHRRVSAASMPATGCQRCACSERPLNGIRCDMGSQPAGIARAPAVSPCSWSCSQRTITSSAWPLSRS